MSGGITKEQLKQALSGDFDRLLDEVVEAVNQAKPGHIIDDSEEPVRDAAGEFRRMLFEKALELRSQREAFPPCGQRRRARSEVAQQRDADGSCGDRQR
jgi:hypothetical protein